jgi:hypothetical protein
MRLVRAAAVLAAALAASAVVAVPAQAKADGVASCDTWTQDGRAFASCNIKSGQFRVRADCVNFPDRYSPWYGAGGWVMYSGKCPWGIRSAILEGR